MLNKVRTSAGSRAGDISENMYRVVFDLARTYDIIIIHASLFCENLEIADLDYCSYIYLSSMNRSN